MRHIDNDGHTETAINIHVDVATINVRMLPGYRSWSRPSQEVIRRWVDENIKGSDNRNRKRTGRIKWSTYSAGWYATVGLIESN